MDTMLDARPVWETYEFVNYSNQIGDVTDEQVEQFRRDGWLWVKNFIDPALCEQLVEHIKELCGIRWDEWPEDPSEQEAFREAARQLFEPSAVTGKPSTLTTLRHRDPWLFNFVMQPKLGEVSAKLLGVPAVKVLSESNHLKLPDASGHGKRIDWHQDYPNMPIDRACAVQTWIALRSLTADMGCMVHMTGSHETRPMGMIGYCGEMAEEKYPWLWEKYQSTEPHDMGQGDVMFHDCLTWHASGLNYGKKVRWGMSSIRFTADALYTGQQLWATDRYNLKPNKTFDHPNFPTVYDARKDH